MLMRTRKWLAALTVLMAAFLFQSTCTVNVPRGAILVDSFSTFGGYGGYGCCRDDWDDDDWDDDDWDDDDDFFFDFFVTDDVYYDDGYYYGDSYGW